MGLDGARKAELEQCKNENELIQWLQKLKGLEADALRVAVGLPDNFFEITNPQDVASKISATKKEVIDAVQGKNFVSSDPLKRSMQEKVEVLFETLTNTLVAQVQVVQQARSPSPAPSYPPTEPGTVKTQQWRSVTPKPSPEPEPKSRSLGHVDFKDSAQYDNLKTIDMTKLSNRAGVLINFAKPNNNAGSQVALAGGGLTPLLGENEEKVAAKTSIDASKLLKKIEEKHEKLLGGASFKFFRSDGNFMDRAYNHYKTSVDTQILGLDALSSAQKLKLIMHYVEHKPNCRTAEAVKLAVEETKENLGMAPKGPAVGM